MLQLPKDTLWLLSKSSAMAPFLLKVVMVLAKLSMVEDTKVRLLPTVKVTWRNMGIRITKVVSRSNFSAVVKVAASKVSTECRGLEASKEASQRNRDSKVSRASVESTVTSKASRDSKACRDSKASMV